MKRFYYMTLVTNAAGYQRWYIDAENFEEAKRKIEGSEDSGTFVDQEIEVTDISEPEWEDIEGEEIK